MVAEVRPEYDTEWAAMKAVAQKLGIGTKRDAAQVGAAGPYRRRDPPGRDDGGIRTGQGDEEGDRRAEAGERDPQGRGVFLRGRARPATHTLVAFIDEHKDRFGGVEPICRVLTDHDCKIAPSTYYAHHKRQAAPAARTVRDAELKTLITLAYEETTASTAPGRSGGT